VDRDSSVGIATRCGLDCPGIEFRVQARFSGPVQKKWVPGLYPGGHSDREVALSTPLPRIPLHGLHGLLKGTFTFTFTKESQYTDHTLGAQCINCRS